jgi:hypothetical protein
MADVSSKLLGQFVTCLETNVLAGDQAPTAAPSTAPEAAAAPVAASSPTAASVQAAGAQAAPAARTIDAPEAEAVDLMRLAGGAVARRVVPALIATLVVLGLVVWLVNR